LHKRTVDAPARRGESAGAPWALAPTGPRLFRAIPGGLPQPPGPASLVMGAAKSRPGGHR